MLLAVVVLSLLCCTGLVTSQGPADGAQTGVDQGQGGGMPVDAGAGPGIVDQTGLDMAGSQTGFDPTGGQMAVDQTGFDPMGGQTGFDLMGGQTGFDQMGGQTGFDPAAGQTGFDTQTGAGVGFDFMPTSTPAFGDFFGGQGPMVGGAALGGINPVQTIEPKHNEIASFATSELGFEYTFNRVLSVQEQVVQGTLYHIKMSVTKTNNRGMRDWVCDVQVHDIPWTSERSLKEFHCVEDTQPVV